MWSCPIKFSQVSKATEKTLNQISSSTENATNYANDSSIELRFKKRVNSELNEPTKIIFAALGNGDFTCLHQKQAESSEIFTLLKGRDDGPNAEIPAICSSSLC